MKTLQFHPLGDSAVTVVVPNAAGACTQLRAARPRCVVDIVAAFDAVTIFYDPCQMQSDGLADFSKLCGWIESVLSNVPESSDEATGPLIEIPVRYGGDCGPDLRELATAKKLSPADLVSLHTSVEYVVGAVGFLPGFAYLLNLPEKLHTPRRATPSTKVPAGSVAIGGSYTGVYPSSSPGGWHIIGQTLVKLFDLTRETPSLLHTGTRVRFREIGSRRTR